MRRRPADPRHRAGWRAAVHRLRRRAGRLHLPGVRTGRDPLPPGRLRQLRPGRAAGRPPRRRDRPHPARAGAVRRSVLPDETAPGRDNLDPPPACPEDAAHPRRPGHAGHARDAQRHVAVAVGGLPARPADAARRPAARRPQPGAVRPLAGRGPGPDQRARSPPGRRAVRLLARPEAAARLRRPRPGHRQADPAGPRRGQPGDRVPRLAARPGPRARGLQAGRCRCLVRLRLHRPQADPRLPALGDEQQAPAPARRPPPGHPQPGADQPAAAPGPAPAAPRRRGDRPAHPRRRHPDAALRPAADPHPAPDPRRRPPRRRRGHDPAWRPACASSRAVRQPAAPPRRTAAQPHHRHQRRRPLAVPRPPRRPAYDPGHHRKAPARGGRTAALRQLVLQAPAPVIATMLGYSHDGTAQVAAEAGSPWSRYAPGDHARPRTGKGSS